MLHDFVRKATSRGTKPEPKRPAEYYPLDGGEMAGEQSDDDKINTKDEVQVETEDPA